MRKEKEKEEEEEIRHVWPFYVLSLNPSKQKKSSKTGNQCNQYKQPTVNGSAMTDVLSMIGMNLGSSHLPQCWRSCVMKSLNIAASVEL